jgi:hypothetical protein
MRAPVLSVTIADRGAHLQSFEYINLTVARAADVAPTVRYGFILDSLFLRQQAQSKTSPRRETTFTQANVSFDEFSFLVKRGGAQSMQSIPSATPCQW